GSGADRTSPASSCRADSSWPTTSRGHRRERCSAVWCASRSGATVTGTSTEAPGRPLRPTRDPFLDVVRSVAMVCVVLNHYTFSHVWPGTSFADGAHWKFVQVEGQPWVTWPFVFELAAFFFVGGATAYRSALTTPF